MNPIKSIVAATLLSTGLLATAVRAEPVAAPGAELRPPTQAMNADPASAEKELRFVYLSSRPAVWNTNRSRTIEATVDYYENGARQSVVLTVGPGQKVPYKAKGTSAGSPSIAGARYLN